MVLVITRWFPNKYEPVKCVFTKNILDAQVRYTKYNYTLISPVPYFPKVAFGSEKFKNFSKLNYKESGNGYDIYRPKYFKLPYFLSQKWEWYTYFRSVLRVIKKENLRFDIVHSHGLYPDGYVAVKIGEYFGVAVVTHLHDSYFKEIYKSRWYKIDKILTFSKRIIAVSKFQKSNIVKIYHDHANKVLIVYNGIDTNKFNTSDYRHRTKKEYNLVFVGNLVGVKGVDVLIRALSLLRNEFSITLSIYGEGKDKKKYQDMVSKLGITNTVKFKGYVDNDLLPRYFNKYSFLVLPSYYETFGIVLIEAMACGIPVIASKVGAIPEIVTSNEVGILVEPNSPESLAEGIKKAINKNWERQKIKEYAKKFSIENTAKAIETVYDEILKGFENERKRAL